MVINRNVLFHYNFNNVFATVYFEGLCRFFYFRNCAILCRFKQIVWSRTRAPCQRPCWVRVHTATIVKLLTRGWIGSEKLQIRTSEDVIRIREKLSTLSSKERPSPQETAMIPNIDIKLNISWITEYPLIQLQCKWILTNLMTTSLAVQSRQWPVSTERMHVIDTNFVHVVWTLVLDHSFSVCSGFL